MISKLSRPEEGGGRLAIVFNGSPLFTGGAGSGESEIRRWIIENDWLEGDRRPAGPALLQHRDQHVLLDRHEPQAARAPRQSAARRCPRVLREDAQEPRQQAQRDQPRADRRDHPVYGAFEESEQVKILPNESFGYQRITVERPLRLRYT